MRGKVERILITMGVLGSWFFLLQGVNFVQAKDEEYPTKPITFYIHDAPGGASNDGARALIEATNKYLGQPFIPINKPGGGGTVSAMTVMNSKPDGYALGTYRGLRRPHPASYRRMPV